MFEQYANVFGGTTDMSAAADEEHVPALPAPEREIPAAPAQPFVPPGAVVMPTAANPGSAPMPMRMAPMQQGPMQPLEGPLEIVEPKDNTAGRSAGITALLLTGATGAGYAAAGPWGAATGASLAGATANLYRAQKWFKSEDPSERHEAVVSTVFAVAGLGLAAWLGYQAYQHGSSPLKGSDDSESDSDVETFEEE